MRLSLPFHATRAKPGTVRALLMQASVADTPGRNGVAACSRLLGANDEKYFGLQPLQHKRKKLLNS